DGTGNSKKKIIEAAAKVFTKNGYASNIDTIAKAAGVVRRTVFNQFKNKEELFRAVILYLTDKQIHSHFKVSEDQDFRESLHSFAAEYVDFILKPESIHSHRLSVMEIYKHPDLARLVYQSGVGYLEAKLSQMLKKEIEAGRLRAMDTDLAAARFLAGVIGSARQRALLGLGTDSREKRAAAVEAAVDEFIRGNAP
ncbi:MAG: TetR/AcrR family transcriptional regulator, partial [Bacteroidales bacterium]|nr:TetR/AcrR family transcriptional regulator [Bacteroidales bacterium]